MKPINKISVFFGFDNTGKQQAIKKILDNFKGDIHIFDNERYSNNREKFWNDLYEALLTQDIFSREKIIYLKAGDISNKEIIDFILKLPDNLCANFIIECGELTQNQVKILKKNQRIDLFEYKKFYEKDFKKWLADMFKEYGKKADNILLDMFYEISNGNKELCLTEVKKICLYCSDDDLISFEMVRDIISINPKYEWVAMDFTRAFFLWNIKQAITLLDRIFLNKIEVMAFELLRDGIRSALWMKLTLNDNILMDIKALQDSYERAIKEKRFWEIPPILSKIRSIYKQYIAINSIPIKRERQLLDVVNISLLPLSTIRDMLYECFRFEVEAKNRFGFSLEGMQLFIFRLRRCIKRELTGD